MTQFSPLGGKTFLLILHKPSGIGDLS